MARAVQADDHEGALDPAAVALCDRALEAVGLHEDGAIENVFGLVTTALEFEGFWVAGPVVWGD